MRLLDGGSYGSYNLWVQAYMCRVITGKEIIIADLTSWDDKDLDDD